MSVLLAIAAITVMIIFIVIIIGIPIAVFIIIYALIFDNDVIQHIKSRISNKKPEANQPTQEQTTTKPNQIEIANTPIRSEKEENYEKGLLFEQYILTLFSNFIIEDVTSDYHNKAKGIIVESSMNPDFRIRHDPTKTVFAVECKYRRSTYWDNEKREHYVKWSYPEQFNRYKEYQKNNNIPVCVIIGIGENPSKPTDIFLIPLNSLHSPIITQTRLFQFRRNSWNSFTWSEIRSAIEK